MVKMPSMIRRFALSFCLAATADLACDCIVLSAKEATRYSEVVFRGTIVGFRDSGAGYKMVVFQVNRVRKGQAPKTFEVANLGVESCDGFFPVKVGYDLLACGDRHWPNPSLHLGPQAPSSRSHTRVFEALSALSVRSSFGSSQIDSCAAQLSTPENALWLHSLGVYKKAN
jgi:hypothetical protein